LNPDTLMAMRHRIITGLLVVGTAIAIVVGLGQSTRA